ncbi:MAG TPA: hypothetical protein VJY54_08390 [Lachnospiraceae bacterium]|nr:hypothetical protein [Lachnospiraceae bacterium]
MKKKWISISLLVVSIVLVIVYFAVMFFEITHFNPYNTGVPFFLDRVLEFLVPVVICLVIRHKIKKRE